MSIGLMRFCCSATDKIGYTNDKDGAQEKRDKANAKNY